MQKTIYVLKASGEKEKFMPNKLKRTCLSAGAPPDLANKVVREVTKRAYDGITTKEILRMTLFLLHKDMPHVAAKYDLKGALMRLGPAGFEFERLFAEILKEYGYETRVHQFVQGECVRHEVDIVVAKPIKSHPELPEPHLKYYQIECKYHNAQGIFTGIKDVLYTYARFLDLQGGFKKGLCQRFDQCWLACNTKFSTDALEYANCKDIKLTGWRYPTGASLETMIEEKKLYPITVLRSLDKDSQLKMSVAGLMLCRDLLKKDFDKLVEITKINPKKMKTMINEAEKILA